MLAQSGQQPRLPLDHVTVHQGQLLKPAASSGEGLQALPGNKTTALKPETSELIEVRGHR